MEQVTTVLTEVIGEQERLLRLHRVEHLDGVANVLNSEGQIVWSLPLRASFLQDCERVGENLGSVADHVDNHEDHLLLAMRNLIEAKGRKVQLIVGLEDIFEGWQCVDDVPIILLRMLIDFHPRCTTAHFFLFQL